MIGIIASVGDCQELVSTKLGGKVLFKRDAVLYDDSNTEVRLTLWGDRAQDPHCAAWVDQIVALRGAKVGEFQGKNLGTTASTAISVNPAMEEGKALYLWNVSRDKAVSRKTLSGGGQG